MPIGILYWVLFVLGVIFGLSPEPTGFKYWRQGGNLLLLILLFLLGWHSFGFVVHD